MDPKQRHNVLRTLRGLVAKRVIYAKTNGSNRPLTWGLNNLDAWDKALFSEWDSGGFRPDGEHSVDGVAVFTDENAAVLTDENTTVLPDDTINMTVLTNDDATILTNENAAVFTHENVTVLPDDATNAVVLTAEYAVVLTTDNTTVITDEYTTVITDDNGCVLRGEYANNKRNRKERSKENVKEKCASHPALQETARTAHQVMFGAICEALGWDSRTITEGDKLRVAQGAKILTRADYAAGDIQRFMVEVWFRDWRWQKYQQRPTLTQLRQEIGKVRLEPDDSDKYAGKGARGQPQNGAEGAVQLNVERRGGDGGKGNRYGPSSAIEADFDDSTTRAARARRFGVEYDLELQRQFDEHRARRKAEGSLYFK
jgi:hypothetical protein